VGVGISLDIKLKAHANLYSYSTLLICLLTGCAQLVELNLVERLILIFYHFSFLIRLMWSSWRRVCVNKSY